MDKQKLIEYLEIVVDLEKQRYLQKKTIDALDQDINSLGIQDAIRKPRYNSDPIGIASDWAGVGLIIGAIAAIATCKGSIFNVKLIEYGLIGAASLFVLGLIVGFLMFSSEKKEKLAKYNAAVQKDDNRVSLELVQRERLQAERDMLNEQLTKTDSLLQKYYATEIIYAKYHNDFVAVASFLDYFKSGRCSTLGENRGGDGAYNTYEAELLQHRILNKLDQIIESLEQIKSNQWTIYSAIQDGNRISAGLVDATNRLAAASEDTAANSAIAAYNSQQSANELNQIKWLQLYSAGK